MPKIVAERSTQFQISVAAMGASNVTQFASGPDGRLYASTSSGGVLSFSYNPANGTLGDQRTVSNISGLGIAFQQSTGQMYLSTTDGSIYRLSQNKTDGTWGGPGQTNVAIVQNIPQGDHNVDNIQIVGDSLYVGIGTRTVNGGTGSNSGAGIDDYGGKGMFAGGAGNTFGDSAYNGTISWIRDLNAVPNITNFAGLFSDTSKNTIQNNSTPFTSTDPGKLTVFADGARNPFGLGVDKSGQVYFSNNFNRADTNGDGTATKGLYADAVGPHLNNQVYDQFFKAVQGADYGFRNENWRGNTPTLTPGSPDYNHQVSITFDNLDSSSPFYKQNYDPLHPIGLGPSSSSDGFAFSYSSELSADLYGNAFITRYTSSVHSSDGTKFTYADLVAINPMDGTTNVIANGFVDPLAVFADQNGNL